MGSVYLLDQLTELQFIKGFDNKYELSDDDIHRARYSRFLSTGAYPGGGACHPPDMVVFTHLEVFEPPTIGILQRLPHVGTINK